MKILTSLMLYLTVMFITGCTDKLKSEYHAPIVNYPGNWVKGASDEDTAPFDWKKFNDPQLNSWLSQVMASNSGVALAMLHLNKAKLDEEKTHISHDWLLSGDTGLGVDKRLNGAIQWKHSDTASLNAVYKLHLWGNIAHQRDIATWERKATEDELRYARLTLLSEASKNYWHIGLVNEQIKASQLKLDHINKMLRIANTRFREGATSSQDVIKARNNILEQERHIVALKHERNILLNEHAMLTGTAPGKSAIEPAMLPEGSLPQINKNVPASVLMHRPDIKVKEMKLREALTNVDMIRASFYPSFNLTSSIGSGSSALYNLLQNPLGSVSANLTLPLLEWRKRRMDVKISRNSYEEQLLAFKQELYKAMSSIQNELSKHTQLVNEETLIRQQLELARQSERISEVSYRQGAKPMSEWLDAHENLRDAELSLVQHRFNQLVNLADIYVAFGGSSTFPAILPD